MGCRIYQPSADLSVIHRSLPTPFPPSAIALDVQFEQVDGGWPALFVGKRARVRRVIRGAHPGDVVIVRDRVEIRITCYEPVRYGGSGIIIGIPAGYENGVLVLQPIFEPANRR